MSSLDDPPTAGSLVERAVERLGSGDLPGRAPGPAPGRATERPVGPAGLPAGGAPDPSRAGASAEVPRSRQVAIDLDRLKAKGIASPDGVPTRTTEEFRLIKRAVLLNVANYAESGTKGANLIMVTSSAQGEGKTFVSLNLAMGIAAEQDFTVLLVDSDLSRSSIPEQLGIEVDKGLIDVLEDPSIDLTEVLIRTNVPGLTVLPAGREHAFSTELLASERMGRLVEELSQRYQDRLIIFDAPPVLATSEASALALHMGQILFVVEAERTSQSAIREALNLISVCPRIGFVLNKARFQFGSARFGSYYSRYKKSYYKTYRRPRKT
jgi:receptor protein-tyrosine kinase